MGEVLVGVLGVLVGVFICLVFWEWRALYRRENVAAGPEQPQMEPESQAA